MWMVCKIVGKLDILNSWLLSAEASTHGVNRGGVTGRGFEQNSNLISNINKFVLINLIELKSKDQFEAHIYTR